MSEGHTAQRKGQCRSRPPMDSSRAAGTSLQNIPTNPRHARDAGQRGTQGSIPSQAKTGQSQRAGLHSLNDFYMLNT